MQAVALLTLRRGDLKRIAAITLAASLVGVLYALVLSENLYFGLLNGVLNGLVIGLLDTVWVRRRRGRRLRRLPLLGYVVVLTLIWMLIILLNMSLVSAWLSGQPLRLPWAWDAVFWRHLLFCLFMAFTFNLLLRMVSFFGSRSLVEMLLGRFQEPTEQTLAFLFLDVVGSTRLTERAGNIQAQSLIADLFFDVATVVDRYDGEVHRYIGDEMVITWNLAYHHQLPDILGCLRDIYQVVEQHRAHNEAQLGIGVDLRAGLNAGSVLVSEVGDQKRELVYFGDAINVAAGLQRLCKELGVRALIAGALFDRLPKSVGMAARSRGERQIKGRRAPVACVELLCPR